MVRKLKFPLIMKNNIEVRNIEELKENFDLELIIEYFFNGKLKAWLEQRNYKEELEAISELQNSYNQENISKKICEIFNVEVSETVDINRLKESKERETRLLEYTDDEEWKEKLEYIAFDQNELDELVNKNFVVYLAGEEFSVSNKLPNREYIGINSSKVNLKFEEKYKKNEQTIVFENVELTSNLAIDTRANINKNCIIDTEKIKRLNRYMSKIEIYNIKNYNVEGSSYPLEKASNIFLLEDDEIIVLFLNDVYKINLKSTQVKKCEENTRFSDYGWHGGCACKYKNKIIIVEENKISMLNSKNLEIEKNYYADDLKGVQGLYILPCKDGIIIYTKGRMTNNAIKKFHLNLHDKKFEYNKLIEDGNGMEYLDYKNDNLYLLNTRQEHLRGLNSNKIIYLERPKLLKNGENIFGEYLSIYDYIVADDKCVTAWGGSNIFSNSGIFGSIYSYFTYYKERSADTKNYYPEIGYLVLYDLTSGKLMKIFKAHDDLILKIYQIKNMMFTIDILGTMKLWNLKYLNLIGEIQLYQVKDDSKNKFYWMEMSDLKDILDKIIIYYDDITDRILIRFLEKIFIMG